MYHLDLGRVTLMKLFVSVVTPDITEAIRSDLISRTIRKATESGMVLLAVNLEARDSQSRLARFHDSLVSVGESIAFEMTTYEWMWYIRRLRSGLFASEEPLISSYWEALAIALAARSTRRRAFILDGTQPVNVDVCIKIAELSEVARLLFEIQKVIRWAGKGASVQFLPDSLPKATPSCALLKSIQEYDERNHRHPVTSFARLGTVIGMGDIGEASGPFLPSVQPSLELWHAKYPPDFESAIEGVVAWFELKPLFLEHFAVLGNSDLVPETQAISLIRNSAICLLTLLHPDSIGLSGRPPSESDWINLHNCGYAILHRNELERRLAWVTSGHLPDLPPWLLSAEATPSAIIQSLLGATNSVFPPIQPKSLFDLGGDALLVDWVQLSRLFGEAVERAGSGGLFGNQWGAVFEDRIQDQIDQTRWRPSDELRESRRRHLRVGGERIGEIDAIGALDDRLLLVSCKSRPFSTEYLRGDYEAVRNTGTDAKSAVTAWNQVVAKITAERIGDNYDFSVFNSIIGVVVYPFLPFVSDGTEFTFSTDGLHVLSSAHEFIAFIRGSG